MEIVMANGRSCDVVGEIIPAATAVTGRVHRYAPGCGNVCLQSMNTLQHVVLTSYTT
jgi:hypothetical protein